MNRIDRSRKQFKITLVACSVLVVLFALLAGGVTYFNSELESKSMTLKMQRASMDATNNQLLQRFQIGQETLAIYNRINPENIKGYGTLDRKSATLLLDSLNQKYQLKNLSLNISSATLQSAPPFQRKTGGVNTSTVTISFESIIDEFAFSLLRDMIAQFPGFMRITTLNLTKNGYIDEQIIYDVQNGEIPPKVKGEIIFDWLGLEVKQNEPTTEATSAPPVS